MSALTKSHGDFVVRAIFNFCATPLVGAEIGVARGHFSATLLAGLPRLHLYAVDSWCEMPDLPGVGHLNYRGWPFEEMYAEFVRNVARYDGRVTVLRKFSQDAARTIADASLDFVYIDAQHTYDACSADIRAWAPKVKPGGFVMGHDFDSVAWPGVVAAVIEHYPKTVQVDRDTTVWWVAV